MPDLELGGPGDQIKLKVLYSWDIISPIVSPLIGVDGTAVITSKNFIKNEPF